MALNEKQQEIVDIAQSLFAKNGFEGTSVRDIAKAANINVAMINYYFGSKENLLETIIKQAVNLYKLMPSEYEYEVDPNKRLERLIEYFVSSKTKNKYVYQILMSEDSIKRRLKHTNIFKDLRKENIERIKEVIEYGREKGAFRNYSPILIHTTMIGIFMNFNYNKNFFEENLPVKDHEHFDDYVQEIIINHLKFTVKAILTYEDQ